MNETSHLLPFVQNLCPGAQVGIKINQKMQNNWISLVSVGYSLKNINKGLYSILYIFFNKKVTEWKIFIYINK